MKPLRQGDVILIPGWTINSTQTPKQELILAEGEVTGHKHQITQGEAELYEQEGALYLRVLSEFPLLTHEEHCPLIVHRGDWAVRLQREYEPQGWRHVSD